MKAVAFNGSPRRHGNTARLIRQVFSRLEQNGIQCELVELSGQIIRGCISCSMCRKNLNKRCVNNTDIVNDCIEKMIGADVILFGSPTYFAGITPELKALLDRSGYVARGNHYMLSRKVGAGVASVHRAGALNVLHTINEYLLINDMIVPGSTYWSMGVGDKAGDVENDELAIDTMNRLGDNIAWLLDKMKSK